MVGSSSSRSKEQKQAAMLDMVIGVRVLPLLHLQNLPHMLVLLQLTIMLLVDNVECGIILRDSCQIHTDPVASAPVTQAASKQNRFHFNLNNPRCRRHN